MGNVVNAILYQPPPPTYSSNSKDLIWLTNSLGERVPALFLAHPRATWTILFSHGNAEDLGFVHEWAHELSYHLQVNVLVYDYSGYGYSSCRDPGEDACYHDIEAAWNLLTTRLGISNRIVAFGRSLGSGPTVEIALRKSISGVILQSAISSVFRVATGVTAHTFPGDMFCNVDKVRELKCPVYVIHGTNDSVVPLSHGQALHAAAANAVEPLFISDGGHNNLEIYWKGTLLREIAGFLDFLSAKEHLNSLNAAQKQKEKEKAAKGKSGLLVEQVEAQAAAQKCDSTINQADIMSPSDIRTSPGLQHEAVAGSSLAEKVSGSMGEGKAIPTVRGNLLPPIN